VAFAIPVTPAKIDPAKERTVKALTSSPH